MAELQLVYFKGCPNFDLLKKALSEIGQEFEEVNQDELPENHPLKGYSSPTLLRRGEVLFGAKTGTQGGCTLNIPGAQELRALIGSPSLSKAGALAPTGSIGSILTVLFCPLCKPALAVFLSTIGAGFLTRGSVLQSLLVLFLVLTIAGLIWSYAKVHHRIFPVLTGLVMSVGLYVGRYVYFGAPINDLLVYGSIAGLLVVSIWNFMLKRPSDSNGCCSTEME